jgi:hypothetical protein
MDNSGWEALLAELLRPPAPNKPGLVYGVCDDPGTEQGQQTISIFSAQEVQRTSMQAMVKPVDPIESLDDADTTPTEAQQTRQVTGGAGQQNSVEGDLTEAVANLDAAGI